MFYRTCFTAKVKALISRRNPLSDGQPGIAHRPRLPVPPASSRWCNHRGPTRCQLSDCSCESPARRRLEMNHGCNHSVRRRRRINRCAGRRSSPRFQAPTSCAQNPWRGHNPRGRQCSVGARRRIFPSGPALSEQNSASTGLADSGTDGSRTSRASSPNGIPGRTAVKTKPSELSARRRAIDKPLRLLPQ